MRIAIIDCGTNTFHLMIAVQQKHKLPLIVFKSKATVKLGEGGITKNIIASVPFERGIRALQKFSLKIAEHKVDKVFAFATAAIRNAKNNLDFISEAKERASISIEIISGDKEAELIYYGVREAIELGTEKSLVMDIGGGSTEFIICDEKKIFWRQSFSIGAALLLEKIQPTDPILEKEIIRLNNFLNETLVPLFEACLNFKPVVLVGSSGSFESLAEMIAHRKNKRMTRKKTSCNFILEEYHDIHTMLVKSTREEREKMKGLLKMRVDMIVLSSLLLTFVLSKTNIGKMKLSTYALKEGIMAELYSKNSDL